jgi:hypothetical protein
LERCDACRRRLDAWRALSQAVQQATPQAFSSDGAFWVRLAPRLGPVRRSTWSLVSFLPPFVFVTFGTLVNLLLAATVLVRILVRAGAIAPVGPIVCARLQTFLGQTETGRLLRSWIGPTAHQAVTRLLDSWAAMSPAWQDALLYALIVASLGVALAGIVTLYGWWAACWHKQERFERSEPAWNTAN